MNDDCFIFAKNYIRMKKSLLVLLVLLLVVVSLSVNGADIKKSVCIVRSDDMEMDSLYTRLGLVLQRNGYISAGRSMSNRSKSFGSGFVFESERGGKYVVTNRHVVGSVKKVRLEFQVDNESKIYYGCSVLYADVKRDVAIIALPADADVVALKSESKMLKDGQEVFTAGFPGLGGAPLWQLGKGIVSNAEVNTGLLGDKDSLLVIQHTAQVDAGNSGGPLLVQQVVSGDTTYVVVGINTWKAFWRENTNFSTRIADLEDFIVSYEHKVSKSKTETLDDAASNFAKDLSKGYRRVVDYFSPQILQNMTDDKLVSLLKIVDDTISSTIRSGDPEYGIRMLVVKDMCEKLKNVADVKLQSADDHGDGSGNTVFVENKSNISYGWQLFEDGWKIVKTNAVNLDKTRVYVGYQNSSHRLTYRGMIGTTLFVPVHESQGVGLMFHCLFVFGSYFTTGVDLGMQGTHLRVANGQYDPNCNYDFSLQINAGIQLPIRRDRIAVSPYALGGFGFDLVKNYNYFGRVEKNTQVVALVKGGIRVGYVFNNGNQIYLAPEYKFKIMPDIRYKSDYFGHYVGLMVGFEWNKRV